MTKSSWCVVVLQDSSDFRVMLYDRDTLRSIRALQGHTAAVTCVAFIGDSKIEVPISHDLHPSHFGALLLCRKLMRHEKHSWLGFDMRLRPIATHIISPRLEKTDPSGPAPRILLPEFMNLTRYLLPIGFGVSATTHRAKCFCSRRRNPACRTARSTLSL